MGKTLFMKLWPFMIISLLFIVSCKKNKEVNNGSYLGKWELTSSTSNGIVYTKTDYQQGNGNTLTFTSDGVLVITGKQSDTSYTKNYTYHLGKGKACGHNEAIDTVLYYGNAQPEVMYVHDGLLFLESTQCVEAGGSAGAFSYRKIN